MIIPDELATLATESKAAQRLVQLLEGSQADRVPPEILGCIVEILRDLKASKSGKSEINGAGANDQAMRRNVGGAASVIEQLTFLHPRGKHSMAFFDDCILIKTNKNDVVIPYPAVEDIVILDSIPKDTKGRVWILLHLNEAFNIMNGKVRMRSCVIQVQASQELEMVHPKDTAQKLCGNAAVVLCQALGIIGVSPDSFHSSDTSVFQSFDQAAAVESFVKARQGYLFPLKAGLCFLESPAMFIPVNSIKSIDFARAGGASSTFDLHIYLKNGGVEEFSNISRHELGSLEAWVQGTNLVTGASSSEEPEDGDKPDGSEDTSDNDSDEEDENFDPYARKRRKLESGSGHSDDDGSDTEDSNDDDADNDVELVSEEDFTLEQLNNMIEKEK